jgi:hypothetical protein
VFAHRLGKRAGRLPYNSVPSVFMESMVQCVECTTCPPGSHGLPNCMVDPDGTAPSRSRVSVVHARHRRPRGSRGSGPRGAGGSSHGRLGGRCRGRPRLHLAPEPPRRAHHGAGRRVNGGADDRCGSAWIRDGAALLPVRSGCPELENEWPQRYCFTWVQACHGPLHWTFEHQ